ncbi:MAG: hypothetical protein QM725_08570 [Lacibacter sp.]
MQLTLPKLQRAASKSGRASSKPGHAASRSPRTLPKLHLTLPELQRAASKSSSAAPKSTAAATWKCTVMAKINTPPYSMYDQSMITKKSPKRITTVLHYSTTKAKSGYFRELAVIIPGVLFWLLFWTNKKVTNKEATNKEATNKIIPNPSF